MLDDSAHDIAGRGVLTPPRSRSAVNRSSAYLVMLGWHGLVIFGYFVLLSQQSGLRVSHGNSPWEDMWIFGVYVGAPAVLGALLVGLVILRRLLARTRIRSAIVLGTAAASPILVFVAAVAGTAPR